MSAVATTPRPAPSTPAARNVRVTFPRVVRSEWLKFRTLRSTVWTVAITVVLMVGISLMFAAIVQVAASTPEMQEGMAQDPDMQAAGGLRGIFVITVGYGFAQLAIAVLGALSITNEYSSGMIRSTFAAEPRRLPVLWAKLLVVVTVTVVLTVVALALAWLVTYPMLDANGLTADLSDPEQVRALVGTVLYLATIAALSLGVGVLLRHTAGAIATLVAVLFVVPLIFTIATQAGNVEWVRTVNKFLPTVAGEQVISTGPASGDLLEPWQGFAVLAAYAVAALVAAAAALKRRDT